MKQCSSKYLLGLTATPRRKDSLEVLLYQQCGPIRHEIKVGEGHSISKNLRVRETGFHLPEAIGHKPPYHMIAELLATDPSRNGCIAADIVKALRCGRFPLVLADRKDQIATLESMVRQSGDDSFAVFCLQGVLSAKRRRQMLIDITTARAKGLPTVLFATASLVGEGFDLPDLDTLFLAAPISFEGRLIQYVGRLDRVAEGKTDVEVFDYLDGSNPILLKMHRGRLKTFQKLGYDGGHAQRPLGSKVDTQRTLFDG